MKPKSSRLLLPRATGGYPALPEQPRNWGYHARHWNRKFGGWVLINTVRNNPPLNSNEEPMLNTPFSPIPIISRVSLRVLAHRDSIEVSKKTFILGFALFWIPVSLHLRGGIVPKNRMTSSLRRPQEGESSIVIARPEPRSNYRFIRGLDTIVYGSLKDQLHWIASRFADEPRPQRLFRTIEASR